MSVTVVGQIRVCFKAQQQVSTDEDGLVLPLHLSLNIPDCFVVSAAESVWQHERASFSWSSWISVSGLMRDRAESGFESEIKI